MTTATMTAAADRIDERTLVIRVRGDVTAVSEQPLMAAYTQAGEKTRAIVLDFSGLDYMNSGGIGLLVTLARSAGPGDSERVLAEFEEPSASGNERRIMDRVASAIAELGLGQKRFERLKTAVSEAAMNAIEHGNRMDVELPVHVRVTATDTELTVRIVDDGGGREIPEPETPDLEAKLAGLQKARGWGLFLIKNMVDEMHVQKTETHHTLEIVMRLTAEPETRKGAN